MRAAAILITLLSTAAWAADTDPTLRFSGDQSDRTPVFERSGPWMLDWTTKSDDTLPKLFEMRLYDADTGAFIGTITDVRETGSSRKLFEDSGRYTAAALVAGDEGLRFQVLDGTWVLTAAGLSLDGADAVNASEAGDHIRIEAPTGEVVLRRAKVQ